RDVRSDVYSLAAVVYEMLAGEPPHTGPTAQAVIAKLLTERPTRIRTVRDTVPEGIDTAVAKALAKVPADRFGGAAEFATALAVRGPGPGARWPRRRMVAAASLAGGPAHPRGLRPPRRQPDPGGGRSHRCNDRRPRLGVPLRPRPHRSVRGAGRDCTARGGLARERGGDTTSPESPAAHRAPRGVRGVSDRALPNVPTHAGGR